MGKEPQLFKIDPTDKTSEAVKEIDFAQVGLLERRDIQEWIANNPGILGDDLLIITKGSVASTIQTRGSTCWRCTRMESWSSLN